MHPRQGMHSSLLTTSLTPALPHRVHLFLAASGPLPVEALKHPIDMRFMVLASDYDGTLAREGRVTDKTLEALGRLRASGRKLVLVTGRHLQDLKEVFPESDLCDRVVAENGGLLYRPASREEKVLAEPPNPRFVNLLQQRGIPFALGRSIVSTWRPHDGEVLRAIQDLGLDLQVIFNKGSVMVLPSTVNKATGLQAALDELGLSPHNVVAVGDAENDHSFLRIAECAVAVADALPALKERADVVLTARNGEGVVDLINRLIADDLVQFQDKPPVHVKTIRSTRDRRRHVRLYAEGDISPGRSFYFRGPESKLNLRAQNLKTFLQLAEGVDDATWIYHLRRGDYSDWFRSMIKDDELADYTASMEQDEAVSPQESRRRIKAAVERRYTAPA